MSRYVNERIGSFVPASNAGSGSRVLGSYVPVSQYMGEAFYEQKGYALGVAVGVVGTLALCLVYKKVKGK